MPGWIVAWEFPLRISAPRLVRPAVLGVASVPRGSATGAMPVIGGGLNVALPLFWTPPTTWMLAAVIWELLPAESALEELESTMTLPGTLMMALLESVRAPLAELFRTKIDRAMPAVKVVVVVWPPMSRIVTLPVTGPATR